MWSTLRRHEKILRVSGEDATQRTGAEPPSQGGAMSTTASTTQVFEEKKA